jgi:hypothetical protein
MPVQLYSSTENLSRAVGPFYRVLGVQVRRGRKPDEDVSEIRSIERLDLTRW